MRLPRGEAAILDLDKIEHYCLNPSHPRGRHKARVFREALGLSQVDAAWLRQVLLEGASGGEAEQIATDQFGARFRLDVRVSRQGRNAMVRTIWIVRTGEDSPRFVTCWAL